MNYTLVNYAVTQNDKLTIAQIATTCARIILTTLTSKTLPSSREGGEVVISLLDQSEGKIWHALLLSMK